MNINELIARLEAATEGSPVLGGQVLAACRDATLLSVTNYVDKISIAIRSHSHGEIYEIERLLNPTLSIDAALTLLPEWASFELQQSAHGLITFTRCRLHDWRRSLIMFDPGNEWKSEGDRPLPINIVIAALKARASDVGERSKVS